MNRCPCCEGRLLCGEEGKNPRYEIIFGTCDSHVLGGTLCGKLTFQIRDLQMERCTGMVVKQYINCELDCCSNSTLYIIEFPRSANPLEKMLLLASV